MGRDKNQFADVFSILASMTKIDYGNRVQPINIEVKNYIAHCYLVKVEVDENL
jgi:hypothetical protein